MPPTQRPPLPRSGLSHQSGTSLSPARPPSAGAGTSEHRDRTAHMLTEATSTSYATRRAKSRKVCQNPNLTPLRCLGSRHGVIFHAATTGTIVMLRSGCPVLSVDSGEDSGQQHQTTGGWKPLTAASQSVTAARSAASEISVPYAATSRPHRTGRARPFRRAAAPGQRDLGPGLLPIPAQSPGRQHASRGRQQPPG